MEEKSPQTQEGEEKEDIYEIDLDRHSSEDLNEVIVDAVAAVDREDEVEVPVEIETQVNTEDVSASAAVAVAEAERLQGQNKGLQERLVRTLADFDNFRKRTEREKQSLGKFAIFDVVKDFLSVIDNLERAMAASGSIEDLKQGLEMVLRQQDDILRRHGVEKVESVDEPFDPTLHEAVTREEKDGVEVPTVVGEMQKGYLLHGRLLRPAMVMVAVPAAKSANPEASTDSSATDEESTEVES